MNIDILQPAPTRDAIESEKERLAMELPRLKQKQKHTLVGFGCVTLVLLAAGAYLNWRYDTLPWGDFALAVLSAFAVAVAFVLAGAFALSVALAVVVGVAVLFGVAVAVAVVVLVVILIGFLLWMGEIEGKYEESKSTLDNLEDADSTSYLDVVNWLSIPEIDQYRHDVVSQPRKSFIVAEINAMHAFFNSHQTTDKQAVLEEKIKEACDEVFCRRS